MEAKKRSDRRRFLQKGAALAGLAVAPAGAVLGSPSASGAAPLPQENGTVDDVNSTDAVLYGRRSPYVNTVRSLEGSISPDSSPPRPEPVADGREDSAWRSDGHHHAVVSALHDAALLRRPDDRSGRAPADDPRPRRAAARVFDGRAEAAAVRVAHLLHRMHRQSARTRKDEPSPIHTAARPAANGPVSRSRCCSTRRGIKAGAKWIRRRGRGRREAREERPAAEGTGRCASWRTDRTASRPSGPGLPSPARRAGHGRASIR